MTLAELPLVPVPASPEGEQLRRITVERFAGPCGAIIGGLDLADAADLDDTAISEIRRALLDHGVIFFRGQSLTPDQQVAFSRRFGPYSPVPFVQPIPEHDEVIAVVREPTERQGFAFGGIWHSDFSILPEPPMGSILHALEVPPYGGDTLWANQYLAFETLSPGLQATVRGLTGVHSARDAYSPKMQAIHDQFEGMTVQTSETANQTQNHPAVRVHGETGRAALYLNQQYTIGLAGWWPHEAKALLDVLYQHATQPAFTCRWRWAPGDVAFWDNRCMQHMVMADVEGHRRAMHRTTVAGEAPIPPHVSLQEQRAQVVRDHMDSENRLAFDETLATFKHPRYELIATGTVYDGPEEVMGYYRSSRAAFPDQRNEIHSFRHADDSVIVEFDLLGTHTGPFLGLPGTGREFRCRMCAFFIFEAGTDRIEIERIYFDSATILAQLGITL